MLQEHDTSPYDAASVLQGLYNCLTDALVEYTYDVSKFSKASGRCKARQVNPDRLGWSGLYLDNLQPRILLCYAAPCKTIAPWKHFWAKAMQDLPHQLPLHVDMAMKNPYEGGRWHQDRPEMKPYLAMLGMPCTLPVSAPCCNATQPAACVTMCNLMFLL